MKKKLPNRQSIRLKGYDYSQAGLYFITICVQNRECLFGEIQNGEMELNDAGNHTEKCWMEIPQHYPNVKLHDFIIMPNHIHGIIEIVGANNDSPIIETANNDSPIIETANNDSPIIETANNDSLEINRANNDSPQRSPSKTVGAIVRGFKIGVTKWFRDNKSHQFPVGKSVWQRNYWEHIVRNENEYNRIAQYINENSLKWENDKLNNGDGNVVLETSANYENENWMIKL
ncbi:MAG: transposase [Candidatus Cloacimonetes bacterium]|nr:transposase [Candidatus Cloacimonadota bacterium]